MMNVFEKIREKLEDAKSWEDIDGKPRFTLRDEHMLEIAIQIINQVEQEHNNGWIPCSEQLPDEYGEYLCCDKYGEYIIGYPIARVSSDDFYVETEHEIMNDCIAWMPLPKISKGL